MALYNARQSTYVDGDTIDAADSNDEFDRLLAAFNISTGHKHDGSTAGDGPVLVVVGALNSGSITSGFGAIDNGTSNITTGGIFRIDVDGSAEAAAGSLTFGAGDDAGIFFNGTNLVIITNGAGASGIIFDSEDDTFEFKGSGTLQATFNTSGLDLVSGDAYYINSASVLNATTLGSAVVASSLTSVGTLTTVTIDDITINGNTIISTGASDFDIDPASGQSVVIDGALDIDGAVLGYTGTATITGSLLVDDITLDGASIQGTSAASLTITPTSGQSVEIDGALDIDGAIMGYTGASTITGSLAVDGITLDGASIQGTSAAQLTITPTSGQSVALDGALVIDGAVMGYTGAFTNTGDVTVTGYVNKSLTTSITAGSTQTQAGATALTKDVNIITVSGTDGDGVKLPTAVAGSEILIINSDAAQTIQIWPNTDDTIDGGSANAVDSNALDAGGQRAYVADGAVNWVTATAAGVSGAISVTTLTATGNTEIDGGTFIFNETGADLDARFEGENNANIIVLDGGQDALSLGGANVDGAALTFNNLQSRTAITSVGSQLHKPAQTTNFDNSSETIAVGADTFFGIPTWTCGTDSLTVTDAATVYIQGAPVDGSNVTATNEYALLVDAGLSRFDSPILIGNSALSAQLEIGLQVDLGGNDNAIFIGKSSDVSLAAYSTFNLDEDDTFCQFKKNSPTGGGLYIVGYAETVYALNMAGYSDLDPDTSMGTTGDATVRFDSGVYNSGAWGFPANGLAYAWYNIPSSGSSRALMLLDEDGDLGVDGSSSLGTFDHWDDMALLRGLELWRGLESHERVGQFINPSRYDGNKYLKEDLGRAKLISVIPDDEWHNGVWQDSPVGKKDEDGNIVQVLAESRSLINITAEARLVRGTLWQVHEMSDAVYEATESQWDKLARVLKDKYDLDIAVEMGSFQQDELRPRFVARGLPTQILDWDGVVPTLQS
jgi:hypothetical protein